jgi:lipopolysaccharide/colanic/teichoic acid biosynthesis glycosyltransferase
MTGDKQTRSPLSSADRLAHQGDPHEGPSAVIPAHAYATTKRIFDLVASLFGLIVFSPVFLVIAIAVKLQDGGPVFYCGERVGKDGRLFRLYKFRSMTVGAPGEGAGITVDGDRRITKAGRVLRNTKLDELPQLINVLKGDMSFVGPRPEDPRYVRLYTEEQRQVLACRPGITSPASIHYRSEEALLTGERPLEYYEREILPHKLSLELQYLKKRTSWGDIRLILQTIRHLKRSAPKSAQESSTSRTKL